MGAGESETGLAGCTTVGSIVVEIFDAFELTDTFPAELPPRLNELGDDAELDVPDRDGLAI